MGLQKKVFVSFAFVLLFVVGLRYLFSEIFLKEDILKIEGEIRALAERGEITRDVSLQLLTLHHALIDKILFQTFVIAFIFLILSLLALWLLARHIAKPIAELARQSSKITEGHYDAVTLPKVGKRKDEIGVLTNSFETMVEGLKEREKIRGVLNKVVSKDVAEEILKTNIHLGGEDRIATVLFSDIRGFTKMTEHFSPQKTIRMLNEYMTQMTHIAEGEGGVIDKYVGDEIMVLYGVPVKHEDHAIRALSSAMIMIETLKKWNEERKKKGEVAIEAGIGIHTGLVVAGNTGAEDRLNYTVLGASVNLAARLCQAAAPMQILISEYTWNEPFVKDSFFVEKLDPITVKGFSEPVNIYTIVGFKWE